MNQINQILDKIKKNRTKEKKINEIKDKLKSNNNKTKVVLLAPLYGYVPSYSVQDLMYLLGDLYEYYDFNFITMLDLYVPIARDRLANQVIEMINCGNNVDVVLCLDQDHHYSSNDIINLIEKFIKSDYDVLGALYYYKDETKRPVCYKINENNSIECLEDLKQNQGIVTVDVIGLGCCCIKPELLQRMYKEYGFHMYMTYIEDGKFNGEDVAFFKRAKKIGAKVGIDTDIHIKHVGAAV